MKQMSAVQQRRKKKAIDRLMKKSEAIYERWPGAWLDDRSQKLEAIEAKLHQDLEASNSQLEMTRASNQYLSEFEQICRG